jgi:hypothetical protein
MAATVVPTAATVAALVVRLVATEVEVARGTAEELVAKVGWGAWVAAAMATEAMAAAATELVRKAASAVGLAQEG